MRYCWYSDWWYGCGVMNAFDCLLEKTHVVRDTLLNRTKKKQNIKKPMIRCAKMEQCRWNVEQANQKDEWTVENWERYFSAFGLWYN